MITQRDELAQFLMIEGSPKLEPKDAMKMAEALLDAGWVQSRNYLQARSLLSDGQRLAGIGEDMSAWAEEVHEFFAT